MSQGEVKTPVQSDAALMPARKAPIIMAAGGVMGFCVGWGLSMFSPEYQMHLSAVGLVVGATIGWLICRMGDKPAS